MTTSALLPEEAPLSDDRDFVIRAAQGDTAAFTALLKRHDDKMRGVVWRLVGSQSAMDDVLQDAYLKAWRGLPQFRGESAFSSWLYRIVWTTAVDHVRSVQRRHLVALDELGERAVVDTTAAIADSVVLRAALAELPADQLAVVSLIDGQGESYETVAALLGISPGTVGSRLSRARATLRRRLGTIEGDRNDR